MKITSSKEVKFGQVGKIAEKKKRQRASGLIKAVFWIHLKGAYKHGFCKYCLETKLEA